MAYLTSELLLEASASHAITMAAKKEIGIRADGFCFYFLHQTKDDLIWSKHSHALSQGL
jgi:hypothetical protein